MTASPTTNSKINMRDMRSKLKNTGNLNVKELEELIRKIDNQLENEKSFPNGVSNAIFWIPNSIKTVTITLARLAYRALAAVAAVIIMTPAFLGSVLYDTLFSKSQEIKGFDDISRMFGDAFEVYSTMLTDVYSYMLKPSDSSLPKAVDEENFTILGDLKMLVEDFAGIFSNKHVSLLAMFLNESRVRYDGDPILYTNKSVELEALKNSFTKLYNKAKEEPPKVTRATSYNDGNAEEFIVKLDTETHRGGEVVHSGDAIAGQYDNIEKTAIRKDEIHTGNNNNSNDNNNNNTPTYKQ